MPASCTSMPVNLAGLACFLGALYAIRHFSVEPVKGSMLAILAFAAPVALLEAVFLKTYKRPSTGLDFSRSNPPDIGRVAVKLTGLYLTLCLAALYYRAIPEYRDPFYAPYWELVKYALPAMVFGGIPYFFILDRYSDRHADGYWHLGLLVTGGWAGADRRIIAQHLLGWLVKVFFLAVMFSYLAGNIAFVRAHDPARALDNFRVFYVHLYNLIFTVDLAFVCAGYLLTLRILDSHIRSVEPTLLGWMAALACYRPFWDLIYTNYLHYDDNYAWGNWLWTNEAGYIVWGSAILFLLLVYVWATLPFGLRFSNLTHRGILTNGPYRFMKHPAYVSKNIAWWLICIPFISRNGPAEAFVNSLLLLAVNFIYAGRAWTEERHLSKDPVYVEYAAALESRSVFRRLFRALSPAPAGGGKSDRISG